MELKETGENTLDIEKALHEAYERDQAFWDEIQKLVMYGVSASDERGHWVEIRVRVRPSQLDMITGVREKHPPGLYKSQADLVRSIIAAGTKTHFEFFKRKKGYSWNELEEILISLNILGRQQRLQELRTDVQRAMNDVVNGPGTVSDKANIVDLLNKIEQKIAHL